MHQEMDYGEAGLNRGTRRGFGRCSILQGAPANLQEKSVSRVRWCAVCKQWAAISSSVTTRCCTSRSPEKK